MQQQDQIFVQIASYRDAELPKTIRSALSNAAEPNRLTFGICWQYDKATYTDLDPYIEDSRFRIDQVYYEDGNGCCWARNRTNLLYGGEKYTLQIDAHTQFAENWDSRFIEMLKATGASKPILTTYPTPFSYRHGQVQYAQNHGIQKLILNRIRKDLTTIYRAVPVEDTSKPQPCQFIAAGQIFTLGQFCEEVQYDPNLYFSGEEISLSARAFTHGYECFCPNEDLLWHFYQHDMPVHSVDHPQNQHLASIDRLDTLFLGDHEELGRYGFGQHATIQEFEKFSGIDFNASKNRQPNPVHYQETIRLNLHGIEDRDDYDLWIFTLRDNDDKEIYRQDLKGQDIPAFNKPEIILNVELTDAPVSYGLWPRSKERGFHPSRFHDIPLPRA